jgi:asparagine synthase (glutamine-hydrolysing)
MSLAEPAAWPRRVLAAMTDTITHRGPDSDGRFACPSETAYLGFRRLAIRDLDPRANQPMRSASGRTIVVFNGEIYNPTELAGRYCPGVKFRTTGDTEVFLEAFERHGTKILSDCNGMFAAAFYEPATRKLVLVRDRMGKKPLYLYEGDGWLAFGSELRALRCFGLEPDPAAAPYFFHFGYLPSPHTFYKHTSQVRPGEAVAIEAGRIVSRRQFFDFSALAWDREPDVDLGQLDHLVADAVSIRTLSDVPVGAFLSGGIDSTLVAAQLKANGLQTLPTFTVAFGESRQNEAPFAAATAAHLGLPHTEIDIGQLPIEDLAADYLDCYEQPYADTSGIPTMLLCREVRQHVTVALSGDGGDEFFGGYARYDWYRQALRAQRVPAFARRLLRSLAPLLDARRGRRIQQLLETQDPAGLYARILRAWAPGSLTELLPEMPQADEAPVQLVRDLFAKVPGDPLAQAACFDASYYIPDDLQVKLDRASMRVALEVRCPLLDSRVAAYGARLASRCVYRGGGKWILKELLARHVPRQLFERPKQGFSAPIAQWMRGPLRGMIHQTLHSQAFRESGWLRFAHAQSLWDQFQQGRSELAAPVWMLFTWAAAWQKAQAAAGGLPEVLDLKRAA